MKEALISLLKVKSVVTILMTIGMLLLLSGLWTPANEIITLFSTSYGAIITYFFTKKEDKSENE